MDENTLSALETLTAGSYRDLFVLLTPAEGLYETIARRITIPVLVVFEDRENERETTPDNHFREQDSTITLPCRADGTEDLINLSITLALLDGIISLGCRAIFLRMASNTGDCTIILREVTESSLEEWHSVIVRPLHWRRAVRDVLAIALPLGQMRKRLTGAMYVIGDTKNVLARSTQLFMNPFGGQSREFRDISDSRVRDTLIEYARLDGAVIIDEEGIVQAAGVHINADTRNVALLIEGARHATAAAITYETKALAVTVSEKSGTVMVFKAGKVILTVRAGKSPGQ